MERESSQRGRSGKIAGSSTDVQDGDVEIREHAGHIGSGGRKGDTRAADDQDLHHEDMGHIETDALEEGKNETGRSTLGRLVESTMNTDPTTDSRAASTNVLEIDADDWIDKDLEALSATDQSRATDATTPQSVQARRTRRFPYLDLGLDERLGRILLSVVLAVLLWFYVLNLENPPNTTPFTGFTIDVRNAPSQLKLINQLPPIDATVQGSRNVLGTVVKSDIRPYIDLKGIPEGVHDVPVLVDVEPSKQRDLIVIVSPSRVQVQLELKVTQVFPVSAQINGTAAVGYGLEPTQITPKQVSVTGLKNDVSRIAKVVVPVDVEGRAITQQGSKTPIALDANGQVITGVLFEPLSVQVVAPIKMLSNHRTVSVKPHIVGQPAPGYVFSVSVDPSIVTVCCSPNLEQVAPQQETEPIPITGATSTIVTTTKLLLPQGVELDSNQPKQITVTIDVVPVQSTIKLAVAPTIQGLASGYSATVTPNQIELTLSGTYNRTQNLSPSDIRAVISVDGRGAGTYTLKPQITVPSEVKLESSAPDQVSVTIIAPTALPTRTPVPQPTATKTVESEASATPITTRTTIITPVIITPGSGSTTPQPPPVGTPTGSALPQTTHTPEAQTLPTATLGP